ncbi:MAG: LptF/LptG family permease [Planctomycetota bacterium]|nr:LptF/LptG family permease [Planctomycetota bacterium]
MTRTLHRYITREFLRVMLLALLAFTLIVTVFAIIEPLRKRGLDFSGAAVLFALTLPSVVSLTLPIATLFAATIVYGRFSQDNEYLASRASGLSTIRVLAPALAIGLIVTVISLVLNNWITPVMVNLARGPLTENIENIVFGQLQRRGFIKMKDYVIHADTVRLVERRLEGVVVIAEPPQGRGQTTIIAARTASPHFTEQNKQNYVTLELEGASILRGQTDQIKQEYIQPQTFPLEQAAEREDLSWYNLGELLEFLHDPAKSKSIQREVDRARRQLVAGDLAKDMAAAIDKSGQYDRLVDNDGATYTIIAGGTKIDAKGGVALLPAPGEKPGEPKMVRVRRVPKPAGPDQPAESAETIVAPYGEVTSEWQAWSSPKMFVSAMRGNPEGAGVYLVRIELYGDATTAATVTADDRLNQSSHLPRWTRGELYMPPEILANIKKPDLAELRRLAPDKAMQKSLDNISKRQIPVYKARVLAEINLRAAYGFSCLGMVAMGAALGLWFRGGQLISAFALTLVPAVLVISLAVLGKELLRNAKLATAPGGVATGLSIMWSGSAALLVGCLILYAWLTRK